MVSEQNFDRKYFLQTKFTDKVYWQSLLTKFNYKLYWQTLLTNFTRDPWPENIAIWWLISSRESLMYYFLFFNATTARSECQFLWNKTDFNFSEFFLFHNMESNIELACLSSFWWRDTFTIDLTRKVKAQAKLNFAKCLSHPSCLLISSAISFSFSCLLFSLQLTALQVNVLLYPLSHSSFS